MKDSSIMDDKKIMISVIVPVYNLVAELSQCVNSILLQTYQKYELLIIDDGSTDGSSILCDKLSKTDNRIRIIHQENAGVSVARNTGISEAKGEYIAFVDGDDLIAPDYLQRLLREMNDDIALSMCNHIRLSSYEQSFPKPIGEIYHFSTTQCVNRLLCGRFPISSCGCLFRKKLIGAIRFPAGVRNNEDKLFLFCYLMENADWNVSFTNDHLYGYFVREGSASKSQWNGSMDIIVVADKIAKITLLKHPEWEEEAKNNTITARFTTLKSIMQTKITKEGKNAIEKIRGEIIDNGWPKAAGYRTKIEYLCLRVGTWCYRLLVNIYYRMTNDEKRFKTNEKMIEQVKQGKKS